MTPLHLYLYDEKYQSVIRDFFFLSLFWESKNGGGAKREEERESQAGSILSAQNQMQGLNLWTVRSWPETKSRVGCITDSDIQVPPEKRSLICGEKGSFCLATSHVQLVPGARMKLSAMGLEAEDGSCYFGNSCNWLKLTKIYCPVNFHQNFYHNLLSNFLWKLQVFNIIQLQNYDIGQILWVPINVSVGRQIPDDSYSAIFPESSTIHF